MLVASDPSKRGKIFGCFFEPIDDAKGDGGRLIERGAGEKEKIDSQF